MKRRVALPRGVIINRLVAFYSMREWTFWIRYLSLDQEATWSRYIREKVNEAKERPIHSTSALTARRNLACNHCKQISVLILYKENQEQFSLIQLYESISFLRILRYDVESVLKSFESLSLSTNVP
jgi:hypothetical protein